MKNVAKLLIKSGDNYLILYRSNHPTFGIDPDLPGGTADEGESQILTVVREVKEEIGLTIDKEKITELFSSDTYSKNFTYSLFIADFPNRPEVTISWEHSSYEWVDRQEFISRAKGAKDTYMHMAGDTLESLEI